MVEKGDFKVSSVFTRAFAAVCGGLGGASVSSTPLDSGGRPYDFDNASTDTPVAAGATWAFTLPNISSLGKHGVFAEFNLGVL